MLIETSRMKRRQLKNFAVIASLSAALITLLGPVVAPELMENFKLSLPQLRLITIFWITLTLWVSEALPVGITALLALLLQPWFDVAGLREACAAFTSPVFFFVVAMYILAGAVQETGLDRRFALYLLTKSGTNSKRVVLALMFGTAMLSTLMSDVPACAVFMAIAINILQRDGVVPGQSNLAKALMIGVPVAALIGGVATPAGSSINVLALDLFAAVSAQYGLDFDITFVQWMALGIPMVMLLLPVAWWVIVNCYPPEIEEIGSAEVNQAQLSALGRWSENEKKLLAIIAAMLMLWIAGSWITAIDTVGIALLGAICLFMPGIRLIDWPSAVKHIGWDVLLVIGGVSTLGQASVATGLGAWLVDATFSGILHWPLIAIIATVSLTTVLIHLPLPIAPVVNAVLIPPVAVLAMNLDVHPAVLVLPVAFTASCAFLLPFDAVPLLTYAKGYYRMFDMLLPGALISLAWIVWLTLLMVWLAPLIL